MNKTFVIADTHFGHTNIIKYENRPFINAVEMDKTLIANWNETVGEGDTVYHLGDFAMCSGERMREIVGRLRGRKVLIKGNHDEKSCKWYMDAGFDEVSTHPIIFREWIVMSHEPPAYISEHIPYFYLYGHVHGTQMYPAICKQSACVCVERWDYRPVDMDAIAQMVAKMG